MDQVCVPGEGGIDAPRRSAYPAAAGEKEPDLTDTRSFDDRDGSIWFDGELIPWRQAEVHILTHALHYASSVFEGQRAYGGEVFRLSDHSRRLRNSARLLGFEIPWSVEEIDQACRDVLAASGLEDAYMRPLAWRGSEQMGVSAQKSKIHLAIAVWPWPAYFGEEAILKGLRLDISKWRRPAPYTAPTDSKASGLYMICTLARHDAQAKGYDDALMFDWRGQVAEATGANAFFVRDGILHTPTPDCFLNGITRQTVMEIARERGIEVRERAIWPEELESFEQMFLTGSAAEVTPVAEAGPWRFEVGDLTLQMRQDYLDRVNRRISNR
jgi:branched-chain amino acid aminotransferase